MAAAGEESTFINDHRAADEIVAKGPRLSRRVRDHAGASGEACAEERVGDRRARVGVACVSRRSRVAGDAAAAALATAISAASPAGEKCGRSARDEPQISGTPARHLAKEFDHRAGSNMQAAGSSSDVAPTCAVPCSGSSGVLNRRNHCRMTVKTLPGGGGSHLDGDAVATPAALAAAGSAATESSGRSVREELRISRPPAHPVEARVDAEELDHRVRSSAQAAGSSSNVGPTCASSFEVPCKFSSGSGGVSNPRDHGRMTFEALRSDGDGHRDRNATATPAALAAAASGAAERGDRSVRDEPRVQREPAVSDLARDMTVVEFSPPPYSGDCDWTDSLWDEPQTCADGFSLFQLDVDPFDAHISADELNPPLRSSKYSRGSGRAANSSFHCSMTFKASREGATAPSVPGSSDGRVGGSRTGGGIACRVGYAMATPAAVATSATAAAAEREERSASDGPRVPHARAGWGVSSDGAAVSFREGFTAAAAKVAAAAPAGFDEERDDGGGGDGGEGRRGDSAAANATSAAPAATAAAAAADVEFFYQDEFDFSRSERPTAGMPRAATAAADVAAASADEGGGAVAASRAMSPAAAAATDSVLESVDRDSTSDVTPVMPSEPRRRPAFHHLQRRLWLNGLRFSQSPTSP